MASIGFATASRVADDGPIRQRLKDRLLQRQQNKPAPEAGTDTDTDMAIKKDLPRPIDHQSRLRATRPAASL